MSTSCLRLAAWLLLVVSLTCSEAAAQSIVLRKPALHWVRSDEALSCIDPRKLAEHVESLIGPVLVRPSEAEHVVEGRVDVAAPGLLRVRVRVSDVQGHIVGERQLEQRADSCGSLTPAIVFVIGMTIDPEVAAHGLPPSLVALLGRADAAREEELLTEAAPAPAPNPQRIPRRALQPPAPSPAPTLDEPPPWQAAVFAEGSFGELSRPALTFDGRILYTLRAPFAVGAFVRGGPQLGHSHVLQGQDVRQSTLSAGLLSCVHSSATPSLRLQGCVGGEFALAVARGVGFPPGGGVSDADDIAGRAAFGVVAQLTARLRVWRHWGIGLLLSGRYSLPSRHFSVDSGPHSERTVVLRLHQLSGALGLGPTFEF